MLQTLGLRSASGVFVTLRRHGRLRGCIGEIEAWGPLGLTVEQVAAAAASRDPRFPPVSEGELDSVEIEISVLVGPVERVTSPLDIRVGRAHGLWIRRGAKEGVLLPQVAVEQGWDPFECPQSCNAQSQPSPGGLAGTGYGDPDLQG